MELTRRNMLGSAGILTAGLIFDESIVNGMIKDETGFIKEKEKHIEIEVTAVEDLMREHGILRRILIVYSESANKLRQSPAAETYEQINKAAHLFRTFGENYHEKALEEKFIFPVVRKINSSVSNYPEILIAQHIRGREITEYILNVTKRTDSAESQKLASAMQSLARMYQSHAAREDTEVFPAWKQTLSQEQFDELSEKFEDIEHEEFGEDGFDKAVNEIAAIEKQLDLANLSQFTAPEIIL